MDAKIDYLIEIFGEEDGIEDELRDRFKEVMDRPLPDGTATAGLEETPHPIFLSASEYSIGEDIEADNP